MSGASSGAISCEVYWRAPRAASIMMREFCSTSFLATSFSTGVEARAKSTIPARATPSNMRLNFALRPMTQLPAWLPGIPRACDTGHGSPLALTFQRRFDYIAASRAGPSGAGATVLLSGKASSDDAPLRAYGRRPHDRPPCQPLQRQVQAPLPAGSGAGVAAVGVAGPDLPPAHLQRRASHGGLPRRPRRLPAQGPRRKALRPRPE